MGLAEKVDLSVRHLVMADSKIIAIFTPFICVIADYQIEHQTSEDFETAKLISSVHDSISRLELTKHARSPEAKFSDTVICG